MRYTRVALVFLFVLAAFCSLLAADVKAKVGKKTLYFPQPDNVTLATDPDESGLMDYFENDEMVGLALFMNPEDQDRLDVGLMPRQPFYFALSYVPLQKMDFTSSEMIELIDSMGDQIETSFNQGFEEAQDATGVDMNMFLLGNNHKSNDFTSYTLLMKLSTGGVQATFVADMAIVNVGGKIVFCYGMQTYEDYRTIGNLEEKTLDWLQKVVAANPN